MGDDTEETCENCRQHRVALWMTAALLASAWIIGLALVALVWGVAR